VAPPTRRQINFRAALGVLQGWLQREVWVSIRPYSLGIPVATLLGTLTAAKGQFTSDEDEWTFEAGRAEFSVHRDLFSAAHFDGRTLEVEMGEVVVQVEPVGPDQPAAS
jgi:hypothetical protein